MNVVTAGHAAIAEGEVLTGVTAILAQDGDHFLDKPVAAAETTTGRHGHTRRGLGELLG